MLPRNKKLIGAAKSLRKNMTSQEKHLWYDFLQTYKIKMYKQRIIGNYIADFYCPSAKLVIELDGAHHYNPDNIEYDKERTAYSNSMGIKVIRFANKDCDGNFDSVSDAIDNEVKTRVRSRT